jgi:hypothetical protein
MLNEIRALGIKIETVEGTAETIAAADVIYCSNLKIDPATPGIERNPHLPSLSSLPPVAGRTMMNLSFDMEVIAATAAGSVPHGAAVLRACGMGETINAGANVIYTPVTSGKKSATCKAFIDGVFYLLKGCRGDLSEAFKAGDPTKRSVKMMGLWEPSTDTGAYGDLALLSGTFPAYQPKIFRSALLKIGGTYYPINELFKWSMANKLTLVPDSRVTNYKRVDITGRKYTGELDAEAVLKATYDFIAKVAAKTSLAIHVYLGADDSGSLGTGSANTMTDATKNWITNQWASYKLLDSAGTTFPITANSATALTVTGTPVTGPGEYVIYQDGKLIEYTMPVCAFDQLNDGDKNGIYNFGLPFGMFLSTGDDELSIKVR